MVSPLSRKDMDSHHLRRFSLLSALAGMAPKPLSLSLSCNLFGVYLHYLYKHNNIISTDWARLRYAMLHCICSRNSLACVLSTYCATPARHEHQGLFSTDEHGLRCKRNTVEGLNLSLSGCWESLTGFPFGASQGLRGPLISFPCVLYTCARIVQNAACMYIDIDYGWFATRNSNLDKQASPIYLGTATAYSITVAKPMKSEYIHFPYPWPTACCAHSLQHCLQSRRTVEQSKNMQKPHKAMMVRKQYSGAKQGQARM